MGALVLGGYYVYWSHTAQWIEARVVQAVPTLPKGNISVSGFPYRFEARITDLRVQTNAGFGFEASRFVVAASPFNLNLWALEGALDPILVTPNGLRRPLRATELKASLRLREGQVARLSVTFKGLEGGAPLNAPTPNMSKWQTGQGALHLIADPKDTSRLAFSLDVADIVLSAEPKGQAALLGDRIAKLRLAGPISQGQILLKSARDWAKAGGVFTLMAAELVWGPVSLSNGSGTLSLTSAGAWQGQIGGTGALKPEGMPVSGLEGPIEVRLEDGWIALLGYKAIPLPKAFD
jgi:hypothetical protein